MDVKHKFAKRNRCISSISKRMECSINVVSQMAINKGIENVSERKIFTIEEYILIYPMIKSRLKTLEGARIRKNQEFSNNKKKISQKKKNKKKSSKISHAYTKHDFSAKGSDGGSVWDTIGKYKGANLKIISIRSR